MKNKKSKKNLKFSRYSYGTCKNILFKTRFKVRRLKSTGWVYELIDKDIFDKDIYSTTPLHRAYAESFKPSKLA
jgi:hypothetical protein